MGKKVLFDEFQKRIDKLHKDKRYRCKKESFTGTHNEVEVYCEEHNELFTCLASNLLKGKITCKGCQLKKTKQEFLIKAQKTHPNKFMYDMDSYINSKQYMRIFCIACDKWFEQAPATHIRGCGCSDCVNRDKTKTTEQFIEEALIVHNGFYSYINTVYKGSHEEVMITCPIHGDFYQSASNHLRGYGCVNCFIDRCKEQLTKTTSEFLTDAKKVHGDRYVYPEGEFYALSKEDITITCRTHGAFKQTPNNHLLGYGCPICGKEASIKKNTKTQEQVIEEFIQVHGLLYDYSKVVYINNRTPVIVVCREHGAFPIYTWTHTQGQHCPICTNANRIGGVNYTTVERKIEEFKSIHGICYIIQCYTEEEIFFKVGITAKTVKKRFYGTETIPYSYTTIYEYNTNMYNAFYIEQYLHNLLKEKRYFPQMSFDGKNECFSEIPPIEEIEKHIQDVLKSIENNTHRDHLN